MRYYVLEISDGDNKIKGVSVSTFADENKTDEQNKFDAIASANQKLATAKSPLYKTDLVVVVDENGGIVDDRKLKNPYWVEPIPVVEEVTE